MMKHFPEFMMTEGNAVDPARQSDGVRGWVYQGEDGKQMAYWVCEKDGTSKEHVHDFDEYFTVIRGEYVLMIGGERIALGRGDEYHIPGGVPHAGEFAGGTRTIHCFGGRRA